MLWPGATILRSVKDRTRRPDLRAGFSAVFSGFGFIVKTPKAWPFALVPGIVLTILALCSSYGAVVLVQSSLQHLVGSPESWYGRAGTSALKWLGSVLAVILGLLIALALTPPLSSPALEKIVGQVERSLGIPERAPLSFFAEVWCGIRAQALAAIVTVPLLLLLWVVELLIAPAVFVTVPLKFLVSAFGLAWNLFDYPLTLRGVRIRRRLRMVLDHKAAAFGFGAAFALLFWLPCFGVLMLPVGVAAATRLTWRMLEREALS
jgi:CysZ protein